MMYLCNDFFFNGRILFRHPVNNMTLPSHLVVGISGFLIARLVSGQKVRGVVALRRDVLTQDDAATGEQVSISPTRISFPFVVLTLELSIPIPLNNESIGSKGHSLKYALFIINLLSSN